MRFFNVAGPCDMADHYMIDSASRLPGVEQLIDTKQYFVVHAARQSGKTTCLLDLTKKLNSEANYHAVYCSLEVLQGIHEAEKGMPYLIECIKHALYICGIPQHELFAEHANYVNAAGVLHVELTRFCKRLDKPLVIFFDEADCLGGATLISFLRQLRAGYVNRTLVPFVHSLALAGMRNIRDFKVQVRPESQTLGSASPFNIATKAMTLQNFTKEEVALLYRQHTDETGQPFEPDAIDLVFEQTQGQPWLVNAIAREVIGKILASDYSRPVTAALIYQAIQTIILRRDTHIDSLLERLKEERVRRVIEPLLLGDDFFERMSDDYQYVTDLGLIKEVNHKIQISNPIYVEAIVRALNYEVQKIFYLTKPDAGISRYLKPAEKL